MSEPNLQDLITAVKSDPSMKLQLRAPRSTKLEKPRPLRQTSSEKSLGETVQTRGSTHAKPVDVPVLRQTSLEQNPEILSSTQLKAPRGKKLEKPRPLRQTSLEKNLDEIEKKLAAHHSLLMNGDLSQDYLHSLKELQAQQHLDGNGNVIIGNDVRKVQDLTAVQRQQLNLQNTGETNEVKKRYSSICPSSSSMVPYSRSISEPVGKVFDQFLDDKKSPPISDVVNHFTGYKSQRSSDSGFVDLDELMDLSENRYRHEEHDLDMEPETDRYGISTRLTNSQQNCEKHTPTSCNGSNDRKNVSRIASDGGVRMHLDVKSETTPTYNITDCQSSSMYNNFNKSKESRDDLDWSNLDGESFSFTAENYKFSSCAINQNTPFNSLMISNTPDKSHSKYRSSPGKANLKQHSDAYSKGMVDNRLIETLKTSSPNTLQTTSNLDEERYSENASNNSTESWDDEIEKNEKNMSLLTYRNKPELFSSASSVTASIHSSSTSVPDDSFNETEYAWELIEDLSERVGNLTMEDRSSLSENNYSVDSEQEFMLDIIDRSTFSVKSVKRAKCVVIRDPIGPGTSSSICHSIENEQQGGNLSAKNRRRMFRIYAEVVRGDSVKKVPDSAYSVEELVLYSTSPLARQVPPDWSYLAKLFPEVCLNEVEDFFDGQVFLEARQNLSWKTTGYHSNNNGFHSSYSEPFQTSVFPAKRTGFPPPKNTAN